MINFRIPILPVFKPKNQKEILSPAHELSLLHNMKKSLFLESGTSAIQASLETINVQPGDEFMVPAYHCLTMISSAKLLKMNVIPYKINEDTSPDVNSIKQLITSSTKVIVAVHYFGIVHDFSAIRSICDSHNVIFIEDCAHSFFGKAGDNPVGYYGDYVVSSTRKFFPGCDGGILFSNNQTIENIKIQKNSILSELKCIYSVFEESSRYGKYTFIHFIFKFINRAKNLLKLNQKNSDYKSTDEYLIHNQHLSPISVASKYLIEKSDIDDLYHSRRRNFMYLFNQIKNIHGLKTILPSLPDDMVPYMFPLIVDSVEIYHKLRHKGWPLWRWDDSDKNCGVSSYYSQHLLQVPCHQSLEISDLKLFIDELKILTSAS